VASLQKVEQVVEPELTQIAKVATVSLRLHIKTQL
jgi:hypothetical protein